MFINSELKDIKIYYETINNNYKAQIKTSDIDTITKIIKNTSPDQNLEEKTLNS